MKMSLRINPCGGWVTMVTTLYYFEKGTHGFKEHWFGSLWMIDRRMARIGFARTWQRKRSEDHGVRCSVHVYV